MKIFFVSLTGVKNMEQSEWGNEEMPMQKQVQSNLQKHDS